MAFDTIIPSSFPTLYETEWKIEMGLMHDQVRQYMDVYRVDGDRRQFKRLANVGGSAVVERPTRAGADRRRVLDDTNLGDTEIVNLYTSFYAADDCEVERTEVDRLGVQNSPHEQFKALQRRAISTNMQLTAVDGIFADRKLGKLGTTDDALPGGNIVDGKTGGFTYGIFDDVYTDFGANQVLGQGVEDPATWTIFCRHKDLQAFRNDATLINRDFSDLRPIDNGRIFQFRDGYIVPLPDAAFANQIQTDGISAGVHSVYLPIFARPCVAWGETGATYANASQPDTWKGNVLLELEEAYGCTTLDWTGVRALEVPVLYP